MTVSGYVSEYVQIFTRPRGRITRVIQYLYSTSRGNSVLEQKQAKGLISRIRVVGAAANANLQLAGGSSVVPLLWDRLVYASE